MTNTIKSFFSRLRSKIILWRIEWEFYHPIASHLNKAQRNGYPFDSIEELGKAADQSHANSVALLDALEKQAPRTGKAYGAAFRYIMYRDLNRRMAAYQTVIRSRMIPKNFDPRFIATRA